MKGSALVVLMLLVIHVPAHAVAAEELRVVDLDALSPSERAKEREARRDRLIESIGDRLGKGWRSFRVGHIHVFDRAGKSYATRIAKAVDARIVWLEANAAFFGPGEKIRTPILIVAKDSKEMDRTSDVIGLESKLDGVLWAHKAPKSTSSSRRQGTPGGGGRTVTSFGSSGASEKSLTSRAATAVIEHWIFDRDRHGSWSMPGVLLDMVWAVRVCDYKKGRLRVSSEGVESALSRVDRQKMPSLEELLTWDIFQLMKVRGSEERLALAYFFVFGPGAKVKEWREGIDAYAKEVAKIIQDERTPPKLAALPKNRKDEEKLISEEKKEWRMKQGKLSREAFDNSFGKWDEEKIKRLESEFHRFIDKHR